jgi:hypothetical protein
LCGHLPLRCEDTARKQTSPDELNSFIHKYHKNVWASRPLGQVSIEALSRVNEREAAIPQKSVHRQQPGHLRQGLVQLGGILAAATGLRRLPSALPSDNGGNRLDDFPGLDTIRQRIGNVGQ